MSAIRCGHIGLTCADLERSKRFYSEIFGFEPFFEIRRNTPWLAAQIGYKDADVSFCHMRGAGGMHLELLKYHAPYTGERCLVEPLNDNTYVPGNVHVNFWVESAVDMVHRICAWRSKETDVGLFRFVGSAHDLDSTMIPDGPQKGGTGFYMRDPDGHTIEVWQPAPGTSFGHELPPLSREMSNIIDKMEEARSENNALWMSLIRLVYRAAPDEARKIFRKIEAQDAEILKLAQSSADL